MYQVLMLLLLIAVVVFGSLLCVTVKHCFFFFKQKTAYELCGRDWSSDVCSSDLKKPTPTDLPLPAALKSAAAPAAEAPAEEAPAEGDRKSVV